MESDNIHYIELDGRQIILIGTAHVSARSVDDVKEVIQKEQPETVCIELCESRYRNITDADRWKNTNITKIIKDGQALLLLVNLILSSYQKRLAQQFNIKPGQEMLQGIASAKEVGAELCLADRDIQTTMMRLWRSIGLWGKTKLFFQLLMSMFIDEEIDEQEMEKMKSGDMLSSALEELAQAFPHIKSILIDERDQYLAQKIKEAPGNKVVAVLGAGHIPGIKQELAREHDMDELSRVLPPSKVTKIVGWAIPLLILALIISTFSVDKAAGMDQMAAWIIWNGSLAALGALLAFAHPFAILTAFVVSPISSLNPLLAAGWFAGLTEAIIRKPKVEDFENIAEDINSIRGFWNNKVTHVLLVVALANVGSSLGAMFGGLEVVRHFINTFV
ncbi:pheromone shutdown protein [hydrocarbon metagenome]|uniref:Pheromone shutdown protein n=1 Tax=hydrocarbon metagenome TaxID=938273 RepID=A0A0W8EAD1_9ZZZZ